MEQEQAKGIELELESRGISVLYLEDRIFKEIERETPQGIIAVAEKPDSEIDKIINRESVCLLLLDEVRIRKCRNNHNDSRCLRH